MQNNISNISRSVSYTAQIRTSGASATPASPTAPASVADDSPVTLGTGSSAKAETYNDPRKILREERPDLATMLEESEKQVSLFMDQLRGMIDQQGLSWNLVFSGEQKLTASPEEIEGAKMAIAEDGEWGVRKTAERILTFALGTTGGDPAKLDQVRAAVQKGFDEAREQLGGKLPTISEDTYAAVMGEFDRWAEAGLPTADTVTLEPKPAPKTTPQPA